MSDKLLSTIAQVLQISPDLVHEDTSMENCPEWNSLRHFGLILALEDVFGVHFSSEDIPQLTAVRSLRGKLMELGARMNGST